MSNLEYWLKTASRAEVNVDPNLQPYLNNNECPYRIYGWDTIYDEYWTYYKEDLNPPNEDIKKDYIEKANTVLSFANKDCREKTNSVLSFEDPEGEYLSIVDSATINSPSNDNIHNKKQNNLGLPNDVSTKWKQTEQYLYDEQAPTSFFLHKEQYEKLTRDALCLAATSTQFPTIYPLTTEISDQRSSTKKTEDSLKERIAAVEHEQTMVRSMINKAQKFTGPHKRGYGPIYELLRVLYINENAKGNRLSFQNILTILEDYQEDIHNLGISIEEPDCNQDIDGKNVIYWVNTKTGKKKKVTIKTLRNTFSKVKKLLVTPIIPL